jgi:hypothetical protein
MNPLLNETGRALLPVVRLQKTKNRPSILFAAEPMNAWRRYALRSVHDLVVIPAIGSSNPNASGIRKDYVECVFFRQPEFHRFLAVEHLFANLLLKQDDFTSHALTLVLTVRVQYRTEEGSCFDRRVSHGVAGENADEFNEPGYSSTSESEVNGRSLNSSGYFVFAFNAPICQRGSVPQLK